MIRVFNPFEIGDEEARGPIRLSFAAYDCIGIRADVLRRVDVHESEPRSDAELQAKIARGPNLTTPDADHVRRVMRKVANIEAGEVQDLAAVQFLARVGHAG